MEKFMLLLCCVFLASCGASQEMSLRIYVQDVESGVPVSNASVSVGFRNSLLSGGVQYEDRTAWTDGSGMALATGGSNLGVARCALTHLNGYYETLPVFARGSKNEGLARWVIPKTWMVTNDICLKTSRIVAPIPLCVKSVDYWCQKGLLITGRDALRYDLVAGDWLPPDGKGLYADVEFINLHHQDLGIGTSDDGLSASAGRDEMDVRFLGEGNGYLMRRVNPSMMLRVRLAPSDGYSQELSIWREKDTKLQNRSSDDDDACLVFRIRCRCNDRGELVSAHYGKMYGMPKLNGGGRHLVRGVKFSYYLNPKPLDRNLEWNRRTNLLEGAQPPRFGGVLLP